MSFLKIIHIHRYIRYLVSRYFTSLKQGILKMKTRTWRARCLEDYSLGNIHLNSRKVNKMLNVLHFGKPWCLTNWTFLFTFTAQPGTLNRTKTITWGFSSLAMVTFFFLFQSCFTLFTLSISFDIVWLMFLLALATSSIYQTILFLRRNVSCAYQSVKSALMSRYALTQNINLGQCKNRSQTIKKKTPGTV